MCKHKSFHYWYTICEHNAFVKRVDTKVKSSNSVNKPCLSNTGNKKEIEEEKSWIYIFLTLLTTKRVLENY